MVTRIDYFSNTVLEALPGESHDLSTFFLFHLKAIYGRT